MKTVIALVVYPCINRQHFEVTRSATKFYGDADFEHNKNVCLSHTTFFWGSLEKKTFHDDDCDMPKNF